MPESLVKEFHRVFRHPVPDTLTMPALEQRMLRVRMIAEELGELAEAFGVTVLIAPHLKTSDDGPLVYHTVLVQESCIAPDIVEAADAFGDIRYLADGGQVILGVDGEAVFEEIHRSNMSKLGDDGQPIFREDGKTLKGPNYFKPRIKEIIGA